MAACRPRFRPVVSFAIASAILVFVASCQRNPFEEKIAARSEMSFAGWISDHAGDLTPAERHDLAEALVQIKLAVMTVSPGLPSEEFSRAVFDQINGHTAREILLRSLEIQTERVSAEVTNLAEREERYRELDKSRLPFDAREFLEGFNARMEQRRAALQRLEDRKTLVLAHP